MRVHKSVLKMQAMTDPFLFDCIASYKAKMELSSYPQIDYLQRDKKLKKNFDYKGIFEK